MALSGSTSRYDIEKFNGSNDFSLWKIKMQALLSNLGLKEVLKEESKHKDKDKVGDGIKTLSADQRADIEEKAFNILILSLGDKAFNIHQRPPTLQSKELHALGSPFPHV